MTIHKYKGALIYVPADSLSRLNLFLFQLSNISCKILARMLLNVQLRTFLNFRDERLAGIEIFATLHIWLHNMYINFYKCINIYDYFTNYPSPAHNQKPIWIYVKHFKSSRIMNEKYVIKHWHETTIKRI